MHTTKRQRIDSAPAAGTSTTAPPAPTDTTPQEDPTADVAVADSPDSDDDDDIPSNPVEWVYEAIPPGEPVQFPHEKETPAVILIDPETAPTDPAELHITDEARRILNQLAQSLRFWRRSDDTITSSDYVSFLPTSKCRRSLLLLPLLSQSDLVGIVSNYVHKLTNRLIAHPTL